VWERWVAGRVHSAAYMRGIITEGSVRPPLDLGPVTMMRAIKIGARALPSLLTSTEIRRLETCGNLECARSYLKIRWAYEYIVMLQVQSVEISQIGGFAKRRLAWRKRPGGILGSNLEVELCIFRARSNKSMPGQEGCGGDEARDVRGVHVHQQHSTNAGQEKSTQTTQMH
jgi:hypothetical protein